MKMMWVSQAFSNTAAAFGELSVSFFVLRLLGHTNVWRKRIVWAIVTLTVTLTSILLILMFIQCKPVGALWAPEIDAGAKCWDRTMYLKFAVFENGEAFACLFGFAFSLANDDQCT